MVDVLEIRAMMARNQINHCELAKALGMSKNTLSSRMNHKSDFTVEEAFSICKVLGINNPEKQTAIFFAEAVPETGRKQ